MKKLIAFTLVALSTMLSACGSSDAQTPPPPPVPEDRTPRIIHVNQNNDSVFFFKYSQAQPGKTQFVEFDMRTKDNWKNNPGSHVAVVLQGAFLDAEAGVRGIGIALGDTGACKGLAAEFFDGPRSIIVPNTCQNVPTLDNETYKIRVEVSDTMLLYWVSVRDQLHSNFVPINMSGFGLQRSIAAGVVFNPNDSTFEISNLKWGWL